MTRPNRLTCGLALLASAAAAMAAESPSSPTLRQAAGGHPLIGTCAMAYQLDEPKLAALTAAQFDCLTPENEMKPDATEPQPGQFTFAAGDKLLAFTKAHNMKLVGHNLCWHQQTPKWMYQAADGKPLPREAALANLKRHIDGVAGHYKGQVLGWDVVNEALSDTPGEYLRDSPARRAIGDDFIVQAFKFAHEADPDAELYYNDYSNENPGKRDGQLKLIKELKAAGCRLDAVGLQGHYIMKYAGTPDLLEEAVKMFTAEGVKVCLTELDVDVLPRTGYGANVTDVERQAGKANPYPKGLPPDVAKLQADFYARVFAVVERHKADFERVTFWGTDDSKSWLNDFPVRGRTNHALLFDRQLQPKPAFTAVVAELAKGSAAADAGGH